MCSASQHKTEEVADERQKFNFDVTALIATKNKGTRNEIFCNCILFCSGAPKSSRAHAEVAITVHKWVIWGYEIVLLAAYAFKKEWNIR